MMLVAALLAGFCLASLAEGLLQGGHIRFFQTPDSFGNLLLGTLSLQGMTWIWMFLFLKMHRMRWVDLLGFGKPGLGMGLLLALGCLPVVLMVALPLQYVSGMALTKIGLTPHNQRAVDLLLTTQSPAELVYFVFFAVVIAPVAEEFLFRAVLYPLARDRGWKATAWLGVSFLFALIHFDAAIFIPLFVLALVLTWLYEKTTCLAAPILLHASFNAANLLLLLAAKWYYSAT